METVEYHGKTTLKASSGRLLCPEHNVWFWGIEGCPRCAGKILTDAPPKMGANGRLDAALNAIQASDYQRMLAFRIKDQAGIKHALATVAGWAGE